MWKWLRSWFAWRFSLRRLVVATVFLGAVVGLNMREVGPQTSADNLDWERYYEYAYDGWGWPLPAYVQPNAHVRVRDKAGSDVKFGPANGRWATPWTHRTYIFAHESLFARGWIVRYVIIDTLFALTVVSLILFFQIPRQKELSTPSAPSRWRLTKAWPPDGKDDIAELQ